VLTDLCGCGRPKQKTRINSTLHRVLFDAEEGVSNMATETSELLRAYNERPYRGKHFRQHDGTSESEVQHRDYCEGQVCRLSRGCFDAGLTMSSVAYQTPIGEGVGHILCEV
jgi:hypothetical protein